MYPAKSSAIYLEEEGYYRQNLDKWNFSLAINERSSLHLTGGLTSGPGYFITNDTWWLDISNGKSIWKEGPKMK